MGALTRFGNKSKTVFLTTEAHKTTVEFETSEAIKAGQPVKIGTDGTIAVWVNTDGIKALVGYAAADAASGDLVTVWSRGYAIIYAQSNADQDAGPVTYSGRDTTHAIDGNTGYDLYANSADATKINGWALDESDAANELIRVLLMD